MRAPLETDLRGVAVRYPVPLRPGDRIGVTSPSSGVSSRHRARLRVALEAVTARGYEVVVGECMDGSGIVSAPAADRAAELTTMLTDPSIRAVVPPWGGETGIDLVGELDWDAIRAAEPTWLVGYSDLSTLLLPLTLLTGAASLHGNNLMETPYRTPPGLLGWLDVLTLPAGATFTQTPPGRYRAAGWDDIAEHPDVRDFTLDAVGRWRRLDGTGPVVAEGRLIGGCLEAVGCLAGTPYGDPTGFGPALVYLEVAEADAATACRALHGMRLAGFFASVSAILIGRTRAPACGAFSQDDAVLDALGGLGVPILADVECGHVPPYLTIVNGARARVEWGAGVTRLEQSLL